MRWQNNYGSSISSPFVIRQTKIEPMALPAISGPNLLADLLPRCKSKGDLPRRRTGPCAAPAKETRLPRQATRGPPPSCVLRACPRLEADRRASTPDHACTLAAPCVRVSPEGPRRPQPRSQRRKAHAVPLGKHPVAGSILEWLFPISSGPRLCGTPACFVSGSPGAPQRLGSARPPLCSAARQNLLPALWALCALCGFVGLSWPADQQ